MSKYTTNETPFDLQDSSTGGRVVMKCNSAVSGSAQVDVTKGSGSAFVLTVIVSNDPEGKAFENHPSSITLTNSAKITSVFSVVGYLWFGVKLTTINGASALANIFLVSNDSPA